MDTPGPLSQILETLELLPDQADRAQMLIGFADQFRDVPPEVATRPFAAEHQVPQCESDAYAWAVVNADGTLKLHFAVESPVGVSAKALATILDQGLSGQKPEVIAHVSPEIVFRIFRQNISMGKGIGLMGMVQAVRSLARRAMVPPAGHQLS
jgi:cysteine desulfuration protein SufE